MSASFIGCKISLISKSEIRYEGILYTIDTKESTIALAKVRSFGTEDRVTDKPVAPRNEVYEYIIFRASDIKDLLVDDPPSSSPGLTDPAIIQAQSGSGPPAASFQSPAASGLPAQQKQKLPPPQQQQQLPAAAAAPIPLIQKTTLSNVLASGATPAPAQRRTQQPPAGQSEDRNVSAQRQQPQSIGQVRQSQHQQQPQQQERRQPQPQSGTGYRDNNFRGGQPQHQMQHQHQQQQGYQRRDGQQRDGQQRDGQQRDGQQRDGQQRDGQQRDGQQRDGQLRDGQQSRSQYGNQSGPRRMQSDWPTGGQRRDGPGQGNRMQGQQSQSLQQRPRMLDVRKLEEYDFEKANAEFEELTKDVEDLKVTDAEKSDAAAAEVTADTEPETYNKQKSFFDSISCEAIERTKGNSNRVDRRVERKMNQETFGVSHVYNNRNWNYNNRGGGFRGRGGGGNYQNRGFNNQNRGFNNSEGGGGGQNYQNRSFGNRNYGNSSNRGRGFHSNNRNMSRDQPAAAAAEA